MNQRGLVSAAALAVVVLTGCEFSREASGPLQETTASAELRDAKKVDVELDMGAGQMNVAGGSSKLVDAHFTYRGDASKPIFTTSNNGSDATVTVKQPSGTRSGGDRYVWDLNLNDHVLTDLAINCGAGQTKLKLGTLMLRNVEIKIGAGQTDLDLSGGTPARDYEVTVHGGVGQTTIDLPKGVGITAEVHKGIGSLNVNGLTQIGGHWENELLGKAKVTLKLTVNAGIGEIRIR